MRMMDDRRVGRAVGTLLRTGVILAGAVVLAGGLAFVVRNGFAARDHFLFHGEPAHLRSPFGILAGAVSLSPLEIIQFGLLLLIATPVARVAFSVWAFTRARDWKYVVITLIVLGLLTYSLASA